MKQGNYYMNNMKNFRKHWVFEGSFCCIKVRFFCIIRNSNIFPQDYW